jgi:hypothetical protein
MIPAGGRRIAYCSAYCRIARPGVRCRDLSAVGVVGGADGTWNNASDGRYDAGSRDPVPGELVRSLVPALGTRDLVTGLVRGQVRGPGAWAGCLGRMHGAPEC